MTSETIEVPLPSLYELRDYYTALSPEGIFPSDYGASSCLIARPLNERITPGLEVRIWPDTEVDDFYEPCGTAEVVTLDGRAVDDLDLDDGQNALAVAFDKRMQAGLPVMLRTAAPMTYRECVTLIEYHITKMEREEATKE